MFVVFILSFTRTIVTENRVCALNHDKELPRKIRRNMHAWRGQNLKKYSKKSRPIKGRTENIIEHQNQKRKVKKIRKMGCCRDMSSYVYFLIERTRNKILIRKVHDFRIFHSIICHSMQFWIGDAIWKLRKIFRLIFS